MTLSLWPTCLSISLCSILSTRPCSLGYMESDCSTVLMNSVGSGVCSISCCITSARTSCVYTFFSAKHRFVAEEGTRRNTCKCEQYKQMSTPHGWKMYQTCTYLLYISVCVHVCDNLYDHTVEGIWSVLIYFNMALAKTHCLFHLPSSLYPATKQQKSNVC